MHWLATCNGRPYTAYHDVSLHPGLQQRVASLHARDGPVTDPFGCAGRLLCQFGGAAQMTCSAKLAYLDNNAI